jgi:TetR/AcrR family transcriptional repressor of nem operon
MATNPTTQEHVFRGRGRPREFDLNEVLDKAAQVFCERGYYATSISDLTSGMGLASGSVYKAFKDKRTVFLATFDRYIAVRNARLKTAINQGNNGRERVQRVVDFYSAASHGLEGQRGCLVINCAAELATFDAEIALRVTTSLNRSEALLTELICQGQTDGSIPVSIDSQSTARLMLCLLQGIRIVGKTGRSKKEMQAVADMALKLLI